MKKHVLRITAALGAAAFLFTTGFARAEDHASGKAGYLKSATYYSDDWVINFWNSESSRMDEELAQIAEDGFNNIILVVPWREFQPGTSPCTYNSYAWDKLDRVMEAAPNLTYFEFLTALGLLAFAEAGVDLVVMEAGLGGHYDATTAMPVQAVCFTPIGMDHEKILGPTLTDIASDKSQAMRPGVPAFTAPQEAEALDCLLRTAQEKGAELRETASLPFPQSALGLAGPHQRVNARLAIAAWDWLADQHHWPNMPETAAKGLASAHFPGRFQRIPACNGLPPLILDGAHNPHGLRAFETAIRDADIQPAAVIFSCLADKDISDMLPFIRRIAGDAPLFVPTIQDNERAMNGEELAKLLAEGRGPAITQPTQRLSLALKETASFVPAEDADRHPVLLCGSLYLLGEFFNLHPQTLEQELV